MELFPLYIILLLLLLLLLLLFITTTTTTTIIILYYIRRRRCENIDTLYINKTLSSMDKNVFCTVISHFVGGNATAIKGTKEQYLRASKIISMYTTAQCCVSRCSVFV